MPLVIQKLKRIKTQLGGGSATDVDAPFDVECACGRRVTGLRRATWIEAECPECCHSVFVLPVNVYPATPSVNSEILGGTFSERLKTVVSEMLPERTPTREPSEKKIGKRKSRVSEDSESEVVEQSQRPALRLPRLRLPKVDIKRVLRRTFTPFRLLMLSMVVVVGLTGYWMSHQKHVEAAQQTWLRSAEEVDEFLAASDMINLEATLNNAVGAGYTLGKNDSEWKAWLNLLHETEAINNLATSDLLTEFASAYDQQDQVIADAEQNITAGALSGSFVFDSWLTAASDQPDVYLMEFPAAPGRHAVDVFIPLPQLAELIQQAGDGRTVFAARFRSVAAPASRSNGAAADDTWRFWVDADSFVLITSPVHCEAVGLGVEDDPELAAVLARQQDFVISS